MKKHIAHTILIDHASADITIDGATLPWHVRSVPEVMADPDNSRHSIVALEFWADNVLVLNRLEDDLQEIRDLAKQVLNEDVAAFQAAASKARQEAAHRHHRHMIELRVEKRRREGTLMQGINSHRDRPGGYEEERYEAAVAAKERGAESFSIVEAIRRNRS